MACSPAPLPPTPPTVYSDGPVDRLFIGLFSRKMAKALGWRSPLKGYDGFVDLSLHMGAGRTPEEQQALVMVVLRSLVPAPALWAIRTFFSPTPLVCELNAWFATRLFQWLVGPCQVEGVAVAQGEGQAQIQRSKVKIERCRYLEQSRCVGTCVNLCKLPTQEFFTQDFGIPLTMTPNFEDFSCEMVFGQAPPPLATEAIAQQRCLSQGCTLANPKAPVCPQLPPA